MQAAHEHTSESGAIGKAASGNRGKAQLRTRSDEKVRVGDPYKLPCNTQKQE